MLLKLLYRLPFRLEESRRRPKSDSGFVFIEQEWFVATAFVSVSY